MNKTESQNTNENNALDIQFSNRRLHHRSILLFDISLSLCRNIIMLWKEHSRDNLLDLIDQITFLIEEQSGPNLPKDREFYSERIQKILLKIEEEDKLLKEIKERDKFVYLKNEINEYCYSIEEYGPSKKKKNDILKKIKEFKAKIENFKFD